MERSCKTMNLMHSMDEPLSLEYWEKWIESGNLIPVFQPIVSAESGLIYGYEVLGRIQRFPNGVESSEVKSLESLGPFFLSNPKSRSNIAKLHSLKRLVDAKIRSLALEKFANESNHKTCLFLNISPSTILSYMQSMPVELPLTIQLTRKFQIAPERIIIEITEERIENNIELLKPIIDLYRSEGYQIAVDDVGSESSNLDRIGLFHPDIIKVDLQMIRRSVFSRNFKEILFTLSKLGESLGSSLLFEGIEKEDELYNSLNYGSRYLQGFYFSKPTENFVDINQFSNELSVSLDRYYIKKNLEINSILKWEKETQFELSKISIDADLTNHPIYLKESIFTESKTNFFRMYLTDAKGFQVSPNYHKDIDGIAEYSDYIGKNWSWRPYFFEHKYKSNSENKDWVISSVYHDISENVILKTFSRNLNSDLILFIDVIFNSNDSN